MTGIEPSTAVLQICSSLPSRDSWAGLQFHPFLEWSSYSQPWSLNCKPQVTGPFTSPKSPPRPTTPAPLYPHQEQPPTSSHGAKTPAPPAVFPPHSTPNPWTNPIASTLIKYSASNHLSLCPLLLPATKPSASPKPEFPKGLCGPLMPHVCQASSFLPRGVR